MNEMTLSKKNYKFFEMARKEATNSDYRNVHVGCVIVYKGHVIGQGFNRDKSDTVQKKYNSYRHFNHTEKPIKHSIHAEIAALKSIPYPIANTVDWKKVSVYIYRICPGKSLGQGLSRPCKACMNALRDMGIKDIYYTTEDGYANEKIF